MNPRQLDEAGFGYIHALPSRTPSSKVDLAEPRLDPTFRFYLCVDVFSLRSPSEFQDFQNFLSVSILPFIREKLPYSHRFFMDNDPKHTSHSTKRFMILNNINHFETPPQSPDLMPIEMVSFSNIFF